jgi:hypothetical protein
MLNRRYLATGVSLVFFAGVFIAFYFIVGALKDSVSEGIISALGWLAFGIAYFGSFATRGLAR